MYVLQVENMQATELKQNEMEGKKDNQRMDCVKSCGKLISHLVT